MEQFIVSARKYRPQAFESVVGQGHITDTLLKSVASDHLAQALLFCGPRGVGKTTCARILAKVINGDANLTEEELALNIFELDAASNNSVDDIRRLIDQVRFAPQTGKFKVYIIDEVHMLSQQAFNAFLKTLEEPPAHAIFILATTEKHKIIPTILSRCQIFDFKRITVDDIAGHLAFVAEKEGVKAEPEALHMIAEKADGALRDALSLFDRMVSFSGSELTYNQVVEVLDILDYNYFFRSIDLAAGVNYPDLLLLYNEVLEKGFNGHEFVVGMAKHFRDLLVAREPRTVELLEVGPAIKQRYLEQSAATSTRFLLHGLKVFNELDGQYKASSQPRILVELGLLKLVEFISQEKKKSQPSVAPKAEGTDQYLPDALPKRGKAPVQPAREITPAPVESAPLPAAKEAPAQQAPPPAPAPAPQTTAPVHETVSDSNLPGEPAIPENPAVAPPPETSPDAAFELPKEGRRRRTTGKKKGGLSLTAMMEEMASENEPTAPKAAEVESDIPAATEGPQNVYTEHELKLALDEYTKQRHVKTAIRSMLQAQAPKILDKNTLEITVDNNIQLGYFNDEQKELVPWLRKKLDNFALRFEVKMAENVQTKKLYLPEEKFKHMVEKNPNLLYLREKLNTDLE
ncbi:MAG: DNA polymerase III subunit gamma/tau [Cryomorphaceae bacterium]|nr:DNA polymerase III subunit gamma/tau [Cryomorphaceae bacterium]